MTKKECFEKFIKYNHYFYSSMEELESLAYMSLLDWNDEEKSIAVTPILNEIFNYALIYRYSDIFYLEGLAGDGRTKNYHEIDELSLACLQYLILQIEAGINHPTIIRYASLSDVVDNYDVLLENLFSIKSTYSDLFDDDTIKALNCIDISQATESGFQIREFVTNVKDVKNDKQLINCLSANAFCTALKKMFIAKDNRNGIFHKYDEDNNIIFVSRNVQDNLNIYLNLFMEKIYTMDESNLDNAYIQIFDEVKEEYDEYKNCQFLYLKNTSLEAKNLKKCKKK